MNKDHQIKDEKDSFLRIANFFIGLGFFLFIIGAIFEFYVSKISPEALGFFGEYAGGIVGSIWSLASIMLFYSALRRQGKDSILQREQLELQRQELASQREELILQRKETELQRIEFERQTEQLRKQNDTLAIQKFENTFFQLLGLHNEIVNGNESRDLGKNWAKQLYLRFITRYQKTNENEDSLDRISSSYKIFPKRVEYLDRYFNNFTTLIEFIDRSQIQDKSFYTYILKAQLNVNELLLLFYFAITDMAPKNLKVLIEKYSFLSDLPNDEIIDIQHKNYYKSTAFETIN